MRGIDRRVFVVGGWGDSSGLGLEAVKQPVQICAIENKARALLHGHQLRTPHFVERAAAHPNIFHGFLVGQASFHHGVSPLAFGARDGRINQIHTPSKLDAVNAHC